MTRLSACKLSENYPCAAHGPDDSRRDRAACGRGRHLQRVRDVAALRAGERPGVARSYRGAATAIVVENADRNKVLPPDGEPEAWSRAPTEKLVETSLQAARDELVRGLGALLAGRSR